MNKIWLLFFVLTLISCDFFSGKAEPEAVAKVNDSYLYKDDLKDLVPKGSPKGDSALIIRNYINNWALQKLLISAAEINLGESQRADLDALVREYKSDLYTKAYLEQIVKTTVDTVVTPTELTLYYNESKENFRTNSQLVRLRYIRLSKETPKYENIKRHFFDFRKSDKKFWEANLIQLKDHALNDSLWVEMSQVYNRLPFITPETRDQFIVAGKAIQHPDSNDVYLVKVEKVLGINQISPFEYIKPTLKEVIINKRKLELIKKFEKEITNDATKDKKYEIYK